MIGFETDGYLVRVQLHLSILGYLNLLLCVACSSDQQLLAVPRSNGGGSSAISQGSGSAANSSNGLGGTNGPSINVDVGTAAEGLGPTCSQAQFRAERRPLDMMILLDQSGSMTEFADRWTPVTRAILDFIESPQSAGIGVALQYFPLGANDSEKCQISRYASPDVLLAPLPANLAPLRNSIIAHHFTQAECCNDETHSKTPTRPAVEGSVDYLRRWLEPRPDHVGVLLLATDGQPTDVCNDNSVADVAAAIAAANAGMPRIMTYVIGIGVPDSLNELAVAGGTGRGPFVVDGSGQNTQAEFAAALQAIRGEVLPCDYKVPAGTDTARLNVLYQAGGSKEGITFTSVSSAAKCDDSSSSWYYDVPASPERILLCPNACKMIAADPSGQVDLVTGCPTILR